MEKPNKNGTALINRRKLLGMASLATVGPLLFALDRNMRAINGSMPASGKNDWCSNHNSVFCTPCGPNPFPVKQVPDTPAIQVLYSFWLMQTTEEWDECLHDQNWRSGLATELGAKAADIEWFYARTHRQPTSDRLKMLRQVWQDFRVSQLGKSPFYPGGGTLLQIARDFQSSTPSKFMPEQCPGSAGSANTTTLPALGPIAFWLMFTTENWWGCLKKDAWRSGLAKEMGMQTSQIDYLLKQRSSPGVTEAIRVWHEFLDYLKRTYGSDQVYGGKPCAGPVTLLRIATGGTR